VKIANGPTHSNAFQCIPMFVPATVSTTVAAALLLVCGGGVDDDCGGGGADGPCRLRTGRVSAADRGR
jgi:hypothetical protein